VRDPSHYRPGVDVVVEVGGWEHECCGPALERGQVVDLGCLRLAGDDGRPRLVETHHDHAPVVERVQGRVVDLKAVRGGGTSRSVLRVPSGAALRGFDSSDDGHLEDPRTGAVVRSPTGRFLVTVRVPSARPSVHRS